MSKIVLLDPLTLADHDPEYAKMLLKVLEEESKKAMVIKNENTGGNTGQNTGTQTKETNSTRV